MTFTVTNNNLTFAAALGGGIFLLAPLANAAPISILIILTLVRSCVLRCCLVDTNKITKFTLRNLAAIKRHAGLCT